MGKMIGGGVAMILMGLLLTTGCGKSDDGRLTAMAQRFLQEQARQNARMAEQSKLVAEASRGLVEADAQSRQKMIEASAALHKQIETARTNVDRQREALESERREMARQRHRDPIIAQTIGAFGLTIAALLPLGLAGYVIYSLNHADVDQAVNELLVTEIASDKPKLLPPPPSRALRQIEDQTPTSGGSTNKALPVVDDDTGEFPF